MIEYALISAYAQPVRGVVSLCFSILASRGATLNDLGPTSMTSSIVSDLSIAIAFYVLLNITFELAAKLD